MLPAEACRKHRRVLEGSTHRGTYQRTAARRIDQAALGGPGTWRADAYDTTSQSLSAIQLLPIVSRSSLAPSVSISLSVDHSTDLLASFRSGKHNEPIQMVNI